MGRLTRLDGLRGVLAVYVMLGHAIPFVRLPAGLAQPFSHGEAAVDLFFALSGLVIINSLERGHGTFWFRFRHFMLARAWRLLPVYFCVLALAAVLIELPSPLPVMPWIAHSQAAQQTWAMQPPHPLLWHLAAHITLLHGLLPQGVLPYAWISLLGPAWSLSTEWQFYLLAALTVPLLPKRALEIAALALLGLGAAYHFAASALPPAWQFSRAFLPDAAPYFAIGIASALWLRGGSPLLLGLSLITTCALGLATAVPAKALIPLGWGLALLAQRYPRLPLLPKLLDSRAAQYLGAISYPLYLLNEPVQRGLALLIGPFSGGDATRFTAIWLPLAIIVPVLAAMLLHHGIEQPLMPHRDVPARLRRAGRRPAPAGAERPQTPIY